jgi:diguanylate cyclase (GGDEF)-like protein/PAS domain S-box-containing protein
VSGGDDVWFDRAPCGLIAVSLDGVLVEANEKFLAWTGYTASEVIGRSFASLLDTGSRLFHETRHLQLVHLAEETSEAALTIVDREGRGVPLLMSSVLDSDERIVRSALFNASDRLRYESDLLIARRSAESSEARVRVLQEVSSIFGVSASDEDVAQSFVDVAREAFAARHTAVLLFDDEGLILAAGSNPLEGRVGPVAELRYTPRVTVVDQARAQAEFPDLAVAMKETRTASLSVTPLLSDGRPLGVLVCFFGRRTDFDDQFYDLQQALGRQASQTLVRVRLERRLAYLALHDQLTGVANRELLQQSLDEAIAQAAASGKPLSVLFLDIDDFKRINDEFGHAAGDGVLVELANRLQAGVRAGDVVGRIGGDEFVALCRDADADAAASIAERILSTTRAPIAVHNGVISASVSVGVSLYRPGDSAPPSGEQLLIRADRAMYSSKDAGKDRFSFDAVPPA